MSVYLHYYGVTCMSVYLYGYGVLGLHACQYCTCMHIQSDFDHNTQHCMNGEADHSRFVSMYV